MLTDTRRGGVGFEVPDSSHFPGPKHERPAERLARGKSSRGRGPESGTRAPGGAVMPEAEARIPFAARRARTFRCPSPANGLSDSTVRISTTSSSSLSAVFGPRLPGCAPPGAERSGYTLERGTRQAAHSSFRGSFPASVRDARALDHVRLEGQFVRGAGDRCHSCTGVHTPILFVRAGADGLNPRWRVRAELRSGHAATMECSRVRETDDSFHWHAWDLRRS